MAGGTMVILGGEKNMAHEDSLQTADRVHDAQGHDWIHTGHKRFVIKSTVTPAVGTSLFQFETDSGGVLTGSDNVYGITVDGTNALLVFGDRKMRIDGNMGFFRNPSATSRMNIGASGAVTKAIDIESDDTGVNFFCSTGPGLTGSTQTGANAIEVSGAGNSSGGVRGNGKTHGIRGHISGNAQISGAAAVVGTAENTSLNATFRSEGVNELFAYSKLSLPAIPNTSLHRGVILVTDAGVGNNEVTIVVYDGTNWIDIRTQVAVV